jgi:hypothetical protein
VMRQFGLDQESPLSMVHTQFLNLIPGLKIVLLTNMLNLWQVVSERSSGACLLGSEGAADVDSWATMTQNSYL